MNDNLDGGISAQFLSNLQKQVDIACGAQLHERMRSRLDRMLQQLVPLIGEADRDRGLAIISQIYGLHDIADEVEAMEERCRPRTQRERMKYSPLRRLRVRLAVGLLRAFRAA